MRKKTSFPFYLLSGTLYIGSQIRENNIITDFRNKLILRIKKNVETYNFSKSNFIISTASITNLNINDNCIDYIFIDPPFGSNLMYSELNFIWESWLRLKTEIKSEAIVNNSQGKSTGDYYNLMLNAFKECNRILKPGHWMTVEFHNSKSSIWNLIQESITKSGFIIANVSILDKKEGSFKQINSPGSVKSDLVISSYKPTIEFADSFLKYSGKNLEIEFIQQFLSNLPTSNVIERTEKMLFSKMISYYIQHGFEINYDSKEFYYMLSQHFINEDGFWFNDDQIIDYRAFKKELDIHDFKSHKSKGLYLFITDEKSAIIWLENFLLTNKTFSEIRIAYNKILLANDDEIPELIYLLEENFIKDDNSFRKPSTHEEKEKIIDKRNKILLREFESYLLMAKDSKKTIKSIRKEVINLGFEKCYIEKKFNDILLIARRLDNNLIGNNPYIKDFIEIAEIKVEGFD